MIRRVNRVLIDAWVDEAAPGGVAKLFSKSGISTATIEKVRQGHVPSTPTKKALASAIGVTVDELFPLAERSRKASSSGNVAS